MTTLVETLKTVRFPKIERAWLVVIAILGILAVADPPQLPASIIFTIKALANTAPYILFAVLAVAYMKASGAEAIVAKAFVGREARMVVFAALVGGLSPFCSCEVIPFIAGLLALGTPLAPVMALWLASPLMDPAAFLITAGALGTQFAVAKAVIAVSIGIAGGFAVYYLTRMGLFADPLRERKTGGGCCGAPSPFKGKPVWKFWHEADRRELFAKEALSNGLFLLKWLTLAYVLESLMVTYVPAETVGKFLGGDGLWPIVLSALVGAPAYLNGYAAPPLIAGLMDQGMSAGAAMSFVVAGGISSIPAATAVFAIVKRQVFVAYLVLGFASAIFAGVTYGAVATALAG